MPILSTLTLFHVLLSGVLTASELGVGDGFSVWGLSRASLSFVDTPLKVHKQKPDMIRCFLTQLYS